MSRARWVPESQFPSVWHSNLAMVIQAFVTSSSVIVILFKSGKNENNPDKTEHRNLSFQQHKLFRAHLVCFFLNWLPVCYNAKFKILVLLKTFHSTDSSYHDLLWLCWVELNFFSVSRHFKMFSKWSTIYVVLHRIVSRPCFTLICLMSRILGYSKNVQSARGQCAKLPSSSGFCCPLSFYHALH